MYFKGHLSIKDIYATLILQRMGEKVDGIDKNVEQNLAHFKELKAFYEAAKHANVPDELTDFLQHSYRFNLLGKERSLDLSNISEKSLNKMKDDELEMLAIRLEQHTDQWIDHVDQVSSQLSGINGDLSLLMQKKRDILEFRKTERDLFEGY